jgi:hypothetical protein
LWTCAALVDAYLQDFITLLVLKINFEKKL